jgi:hypothetical protein
MQTPTLSSSSPCPFSSPPTYLQHDYPATFLPVPKVLHIVDISYPESYMRTPLRPERKNATNAVLEVWDYGVEFVDDGDVVLSSSMMGMWCWNRLSLILMEGR